MKQIVRGVGAALLFAAILATASNFDLIRVSRQLDTKQATPLAMYAYSLNASTSIAPLIFAALAEAGLLDLIVAGEVTSCTSAIQDVDLSGRGRCAFVSETLYVSAPDNRDVRTDYRKYIASFPMRAHPYLIGVLLLSGAYFVAVG